MKNINKLNLILISLLYLINVVSCTNLLDKNDDDSQTILNKDKAQVYLTLKINDDNKGKAAGPEGWRTQALQYKFYVDENEVTPTSNGDKYLIENLSVDSHTIKVQILKSSNVILEGSKSVTITTDGKYDETIELNYIMDDTLTGGIVLFYAFNDCSEYYELACEYKKVSDTTFISTGVLTDDNKITISDLQTGYYTLKLIIKTKIVNPSVEVYSAYFTVPVFANLTTDTWTNYEVTPFVNASGVFIITQDQLEALIQKTIYVKGEGGTLNANANASDTTGDGSYLKPFATLRKAVEKANAVGLIVSNPTIYVDGTVSENLNITSNYVDFNMKIKGYNGVGVIKQAEGCSPTVSLLKLGADLTFTLEDIEITDFNITATSVYVIDCIDSDQIVDSAKLCINGTVKVHNNTCNNNKANIYLGQHKIRVNGNLGTDSDIYVTTADEGNLNGTTRYNIFTSNFKGSTFTENVNASAFFKSDSGYTIGTVTVGDSAGEAAVGWTRNGNNTEITQKNLFADKLKIKLEDTGSTKLGSLFVPGQQFTKEIKVLKKDEISSLYNELELSKYTITDAKIYYGDTVYTDIFTPRIEENCAKVSFTPANDNYRIVVYFTYDGQNYSETVNLKPINPKNLYDEKPVIKGVKGNHIKIALNNADDIWYMGSYLKSPEGQQCEFLTIYLANSIDWSTRTDTDKTFVPLALNKSVFNGNGYSVYGLDMPKITETVYDSNSYNAAFIGRSINSIIRDLTVYGETAGAGIVYYMEGSFIGNCVNYTNTKSSDTTSENGGICSIVGGTKSIIQYCRNYGNIGISESEHSAGIIGYFKESNSYLINVNACTNFGEIKGKIAAGIIISYSLNGCSYDSINYGTIYSNGSGGAGIIWYTGNITLQSSTMSNNYSLGNIFVNGAIGGYSISNCKIKYYPNETLFSYSITSYYLEGICTTMTENSQVYTKTVKDGKNTSTFTNTDLFGDDNIKITNKKTQMFTDEGTGYPYIKECNDSYYGIDYIKYPDLSIF